MTDTDPTSKPSGSSGIPLTLIVILVVAVGAIGYFATLSGGSTSYTKSGAWVTAPTYEGRVAKALDQVGSAKVGFDAADRISRRGGKILVDRPDKLGGLPEGVEAVGLDTQAELTTLLGANDEKAAADAVRAQGITMVAVSHKVVPSVDRGGKVLSRLYHHDHLEHFSLFWVSEGHLFYEVLEAPYSFPPQIANVGIQYLRARLQGKRVAGFPDIKSEDGRWTLVASLRTNGEELAVGFAQDGKLQGALEELVVDLERNHRRYVEPLGAPPLALHIEDLSIELQRVTERAHVEPRDEAWLERFWEMGIDGAYMISSDQNSRGALPGSAAYTRSHRTADQFLRDTAKQGHMDERRPWRAKDALFQVFRTIHYREDPERGLVFLYRGVPAVPKEMVTVEAVREGVVAAGDWYLANLLPNGQVVYKFWPAENRYSNEYNLVRHTLATWNLVQAWEMAPERTEFLDGARKALDYTQSWMVREPVPGGDGEMMAYYTFNQNQKLGTVVVNLLGIIDLARATDDHSMDEMIKELGRFVLHMQNEKGTFDGYYVNEKHPYYQQTNDIVPGEAALSLIYLAEYFDDDAWIATLPAYWDYYYDWFPQRRDKGDSARPWPAETYDNDTRLELVQFGPWTVMAANAYHRRTGDEKAAKFGLEIARWMIETYEWTEDRAPFPDYVGGYYKLPGELPAMQAFCYAEGTAAAYSMSLRMAPEEAAYFEENTRETLRFGLQMQYYPAGSYSFSRPFQVLGGIRYAMTETKVRVDYVHHGLSAMYQWVKAAPADPELSELIKTGPALPFQVAQVMDGDTPVVDDEGKPVMDSSVKLALQSRPVIPLPLRMLSPQNPGELPATRPGADGEIKVAGGDEED